jgi:hypothetical protein
MHCHRSPLSPPRGQLAAAKKAYKSAKGENRIEVLDIEGGSLKAYC